MTKPFKAFNFLNRGLSRFK